MPNFEVGQRVRIPCSIQQGAFPGEYLVTFDSATGKISGFVKEGNIEHAAEGRGYLSGEIKRINGETITVMVIGSFFTTTGLADIGREWASNNLELAHAS